MLVAQASALLLSSSVMIHARHLLYFQDAIDAGNSKLLMIFVGLVAFALLVQAAVMIALAVGVSKGQKALMAHVEEIKGKLLPFVAQGHALVNDVGPEVKQITTKVHTLVTDLTPEIKSITTNINGITAKAHDISGHVSEITSMARDKAHEFSPTISAANETLMQVNTKAQQQIDKVDEMVSSLLATTKHFGESVSNGITRPVREVADMYAGAKKSVESMANSAKTSIETFASSAKNSVEAITGATKDSVGSILEKTMHFTKGLFAARQKPPTYRPAPYRLHPAQPTYPSRVEDRTQGYGVTGTVDPDV